MKKLGLVLLAACLGLLVGSEAGAATVVTGFGNAAIQIGSAGGEVACTAPLSAHLHVSEAGFVLEQVVGGGTGSALTCVYDPAVQGTHVASDQTPPAHRCFINNGGGGVGISLSAYSLEVHGARYTASRVDRVACSPYEYVVDAISLEVRAATIELSRDMTLGPLGYPRFSLTVRATLTRL